MAHYLVTARPVEPKLTELLRKLQVNAFIEMEPFGRAVTFSLRHARVRPDGLAVWEEVDFCTPPLRQEREAVLDDYFENLSVTPVEEGAGWAQITELPRLFPELQEEPTGNEHPAG